MAARAGLRLGGTALQAVCRDRVLECLTLPCKWRIMIGGPWAEDVEENGL